MAADAPDERAVYLALRNVLVGGEAQLRALKKIKEKIRVQDSAELVALVREHNLDKVSTVAKRLSEAEIFQSTLKAKLRFPELFEVSPAQSADRTVSGQEAAEAEEASLKRAAEAHHESQAYKATQAECSRVTVATMSRTGSRSENAFQVPSLYPVYLPMRTQHLLMTELQTTLERACYEFGMMNMQSVLEERGWACAEFVELNEWTKIMINYEEKMSKEAINASGKPLSDLLADIPHIRHTAVHRLPITVNRIESFLVDAEAFARVLDADACRQTITQFRRNTGMVVDEIKRNKDLLESRSADMLRRIRSQQAELEREFRAAMGEMVREDKAFSTIKGKVLEQTILSPDDVRSIVPSELVEEVTASYCASEQDESSRKQSDGPGHDVD